MPDTPPWADHPYARVYTSLAEDHPAVWSDLRLLGGYVRLLVRAEQAWPGLADLPRGVDGDVIEALVADEVIDLVPGDLFRFHGLASERASRARQGSAGGRGRAASSERDPLGRFLPSDAGSGAGQVLDNPRTNGQSGAGALLEVPTGESGTDVLDTALDAQRKKVLDAQRVVAGGPALPASRAEPSRAEPNRAEPAAPSRAAGSALGESRAHERATRPPPDPAHIDCSNYLAHRSAHRWFDSVGWRCVTCEGERASADLTFSEKVARATPDGSPF